MGYRYIHNLESLELFFPDLKPVLRKSDLRQAMTSLFSQRDNVGHVVKMIEIIEEISPYLSEELGLTKENIQDMKKAVIFHDLGKIYHPEIYNKSGRLTAEELITKEHHPQDSYELIKDSDLSLDVKMLVLKHQLDYGDRRNNHNGSTPVFEEKRQNHESKNFHSMLDAFFIVDEIEAMTSHERPYRNGSLPRETVFWELFKKLPRRYTQISEIMTLTHDLNYL